MTMKMERNQFLQTGDLTFHITIPGVDLASLPKALFRDLQTHKDGDPISHTLMALVQIAVYLENKHLLDVDRYRQALTDIGANAQQIIHTQKTMDPALVQMLADRCMAELQEDTHEMERK